MQQHLSKLYHFRAKQVTCLFVCWGFGRVGCEVICVQWPRSRRAQPNSYLVISPLLLIVICLRAIRMVRLGICARYIDSSCGLWSVPRDPGSSCGALVFPAEPQNRIQGQLQLPGVQVGPVGPLRLGGGGATYVLVHIDWPLGRGVSNAPLLGPPLLMFSMEGKQININHIYPANVISGSTVRRSQVHCAPWTGPNSTVRGEVGRGDTGGGAGQWTADPGGQGRGGEGRVRELRGGSWVTEAMGAGSGGRSRGCAVECVALLAR